MQENTQLHTETNTKDTCMYLMQHVLDTTHHTCLPLLAQFYHTSDLFSAY